MIASQVTHRIGVLLQICALMIVLLGCGQDEVAKQQFSEEGVHLLDDIRKRTHNEFYARNARPIPGIKNGWPELIGPLLHSLDDEDPQFVRRVAVVLKRIGRRAVVPEDEATAARAVFAYLDDQHAITRYHAARFLLRAMPSGRLGYLSPEARELLSLWKPHTRALAQHLDRDDPAAGVFIAASIPRLDDQHSAALAYLRGEMETIKVEYGNYAFGLSSSFPHLGDQAKQFVPLAIGHAKFEGIRAEPGLNGRADLQDMGTIAVPFIVQEISDAESSLQNRDVKLETESECRNSVLSFLSPLEIMAANAKLTGTDLSSATPLVEGLRESSDEEIGSAAESTLARMTQDQNGTAGSP